MTIKKENPMKNLREMAAQPQHLAVRLALVATSILIASLAPTAALADRTATVASCEGIKAAYPILGTQCANQYKKINHTPANAADRLTTFNARVSVLQVFRKALLCNGIFNATKSVQDSFKSGEDGHLTALANLRTAMINAKDPNIPNPYGANDLKSISINKQQCK
jgi:hypothetical protein